jgi:hypothetical protein
MTEICCLSRLGITVSARVSKSPRLKRDMLLQDRVVPSKVARTTHQTTRHVSTNGFKQPKQKALVATLPISFDSKPATDLELSLLCILLLHSASTEQNRYPNPFFIRHIFSQATYLIHINQHYYIFSCSSHRTSTLSHFALTTDPYLATTAELQQLQNRVPIPPANNTMTRRERNAKNIVHDLRFLESSYKIPVPHSQHRYAT